MTMSSSRPHTIDDALVRDICGRIATNRSVRRTLAPWGRLHIDRQLPFLCIHRRAPGSVGDGTERLVTSGPSYLVCPAGRNQRGFRQLVRGVAQELVELFGACLIVEVWADETLGAESTAPRAALRPGFRIVVPERDASISAGFQEALSRIRLQGQTATVATTTSNRCTPQGWQSLLPLKGATEIGAHVLGLAVRPVYHDPETGGTFPEVLRQLRRRFAKAVQRALFRYTRTYTTQQPPHYNALGRRAMVQAVWKADRLLAQASDSLDLLLQVTPTNAEGAWRAFRRKRCEQAPRFSYRPLPADAAVLKRRLYRAPVERVEDAALAEVFREKLDEVDRQISMLQDCNTPRFVHASVQLYGGVEPELLALAEWMLARISARSRNGSARDPVRAEAFADRARAEIAAYRRTWAELDAGVEIREDIPSVMVSRGRLLVGREVSIPVARVEALLQHEVGTHVLTYHNGRATRFQLLASGLAGSDATQEGLAVLAEHLAGGLSRARLRLLAGRVVAVHCLLEGATFVEAFRTFTREYGFSRRVAFHMLLRVYRGGGLTKDAAYLRGFQQVLQYLGEGGTLAPLFVGKIALRHIGIVRELQWRNVLDAPRLMPRYMADAPAQERLARLRDRPAVKALVTGRR